MELLQLVLRVVDEGAQLLPVGLGDGGGEQVVHLLLDDPGAGVENVKKGLVLPVQVGDKVLRALGQVHNGLKVDDLAAGRLDGGVLLGQELQVAQLLLRKGFLSLHSGSSFLCLGFVLLFHSFGQMARHFQKI